MLDEEIIRESMMNAQIFAYMAMIIGITMLIPMYYKDAKSRKIPKKQVQGVALAIFIAGIIGFLTVEASISLSEADAARDGYQINILESIQSILESRTGDSDLTEAVRDNTRALENLTRAMEELQDNVVQDGHLIPNMPP